LDRPGLRAEREAPAKNDGLINLPVGYRKNDSLAVVAAHVSTGGGAPTPQAVGKVTLFELLKNPNMR
jgi:hypothetical protein